MVGAWGIFGFFWDFVFFGVMGGSFWLKVFEKTWTSWEVRAISGTRRMVDFPFFRASAARAR